MEPIKDILSQEPKSSLLEKITEQKKDFPDIELTGEEITEALRIAREAKHYAIERHKYGEKLLQEPLIKHFSSSDLQMMLAGMIKIDEFNALVVVTLCDYFAQDPAFEKGTGFSLDKGIILFGGVGVGKTTLMRAFSRNQRASFVLRMCRQIEDEFSQDGDKILKGYSGLFYPKDIQANPFRHQAFGICFDDLGTEPISKYYGKDSNVMAELILNRYDNDLPNELTHITTNLSVQEIETRYGSRVTDRMTEMFNLISFPKEAKSRRA